MALVFLAYLALQLNNIRDRAYIGQDHEYHFLRTSQVLANPGQLFRSHLTQRPLVYWVGAACLRLARSPDAFWLPALVFVLLSMAALWLLRDSTRAFVRSPALRIAALAGVAFLPVTVITCVAYAADTAAMLPFALAGWSLVRSFEARTSRRAALYALVAGGALCLGDLAKFTFLGLPGAVLFVMGARWRQGRLSGRRALAVGLLAVALPAGFSVGVSAIIRFQGHGAMNYDLHWRGAGDLTWRDLLIPKGADRGILAAPLFWEQRTIDGQTSYPVRDPHHFSYPALLHLATFTDVLNLGDQRLSLAPDERPRLQQMLARWAVVVGVPFFLAALLAVLGFWAETIRALIRPPGGPAPGLLVWGALATVWFLPLVLTLPSVPGAYEEGFWLPRLTLPAIWGFALVLFGAIDRITLRGQGWLRIGAVGLTLTQAALHLRSLWF